MDLHQLHGVFSATLAADSTSRTQAETTLKSLGSSSAFSEGCLDLLMAPDVDNSIKIAAGLYLKNHVAVSWRQNKPANAAQVRLKLLSGLSTAQHTFRNIFLVVLHRIIEIDYPENWPDLVPKVHEMLSSEDGQVVWAGLSAALKVFFWYRYRTLKNFDSVVSSLYPVILAVSEHAVESDSPLAAAMLYDFAKIYKHATARTLPALLQNIEVIGRSTQIFVRVLQKPGEEFGKAKKWASFDLLRTHVAYVSSVTSLSDKANALAPFRKAYTEQLTPHVLQAVLTLLEQWSQKQLWLPPPAICNLLTYLEGTPDVKSMWAVVEPFVDGLLLHVVYPLLCPTDEDLQLFKEEPVEYIHARAAAAFEQLVPDQAAENLLLALVQRRKTAFERVITFIHQRGQETVKEQVGTLRMLDIISRVILMKNNPVQASMEGYIMALDLKSSEPVVRSQMLHLIGTYATLELSREALQQLYVVSLESLWDEHLPVQVDAARALQSLSEHEDVKAAIGEHIPRILQHLLDLTKKIDLDSLLNVMDVFIDMHPEQVTPFAVELVAQLRDQFLSVASELAEAAANMNPEQFDIEDDFLSEKRDTASSILRTVENLQYSLDKHVDILQQLETVIAPIFQAVYEHELLEFYAETLALHENTMYSTKSVSPLMWSLLPLVVRALQAGGFESLDDANAVFENYISYGKEVLATESSARDIIMGLIIDILSSNILTVTDWMQVLQLARMALSTSELRGNMDSYLEPLLSAVLGKIVQDCERWNANHRYGVALLGVVQAAIYNSTASLEYLKLQQATAPVANLWLQSLSSIKNVENLKLQELAILVILSQHPAEWEPYLPQLLKALSLTIEALPGALARLEEQRKAFDEDDLDFEDPTDDWDDIDDGFAEDLNVRNETPADFIASTSGGEAKHEFIPFDYSEDRDANPYLVSPLDTMDPFAVLKQAFSELAEQTPEWYSVLMGMLSEHERAILQDGALRA